MAALHFFGAIETIEQIEAALIRVDEGSYGACQSCGQPIPLEGLEVSPEARYCANCTAPVTSFMSTLESAGPRHRRGPAARRGLAAASAAGSANGHRTSHV
jgi:hypothetical protein